MKKDYVIKMKRTKSTKSRKAKSKNYENLL